MNRHLFRVRYADTDRMGFAYYARYLEWFEVGRAEMIRAQGTTYRVIEESGVSLPVVEARCRYLTPARYDDLIAVETAVLGRGRASVRFGYRVRRESEPAGAIAWGFTEHCFLDRSGRPTRPPPEVVELLERAPQVTEADLAG
jgi:acyl-CoA thioester hydrolase